MFLTSKSNPDNSDHSWRNLAHSSLSFTIITFAWTAALAGLMSITFVRQPLWWLLLCGFTLILAAIFQIFRLWSTRPIFPRPYSQKSHLVKIHAQVTPSQEDDVRVILQQHLSSKAPQIAAAFELPFQRAGVHTEDYRQEIEAAINALYDRDTDHQAFSFCLHRLLQAAKQNWTGLAAFSPREREILELLLQNITYKEMSSRLHVSISTIKTHVYHVFQKLGISNREEAICLIRERGWFFINERDLLPTNK